MNGAPGLQGTGFDPTMRRGGEDAPSMEEELYQLGLQLVPTKAPVERMAIDHIEKPEED